jgi:hypothetical protein
MIKPTKLILGVSSFALLSLTSLQAQNTVGGVSTSSGVGGGNRNLIWNSSYAWIGGGFTNLIVSGANFSTIGGGYSNAVTTAATFATIGGGFLNLANSSFATIGGGSYNSVATNATNSTISGGMSNQITANSRWSTIGGGTGNRILNGAVNASIGGGSGNSVGATGGTVAGGNGNDVGSAPSGAIGGGAGNFVSGNSGTIPGGSGNRATNFAFAAGRAAEATNTSAFVWSGDSGGAASTNPSSFTVRASGGSRFISTATGETGVILAANATAWAVLSDSNAKSGVHTINPRQILAKVAALPVTSWH